MRLATCDLEGISPYAQSRPIESIKDRDETHDEFERRTWKERAHTFDDGMVYIPPMAFKNCLSEAAKYKSIKIPGKGNSTYTKHFEAGILVVDPVPLGIHIDDARCQRLFIPADGKRGGGKRVWKQFPVFDKWRVKVKFFCLDEVVNEDVFERHLVDAGQFIGIGMFRPRNNGFYGRFNVLDVEWEKQM